VWGCVFLCETTACQQVFIQLYFRNWDLNFQQKCVYDWLKSKLSTSQTFHFVVHCVFYQKNECEWRDFCL
jgi:hypothetical protein